MASATARRLRQKGTEAERRLWMALRDRRLAGYKFRRQRPIGPYIADFVSVRHRLIVEVDGSRHLDSAADARRTAWLETHGWSVIRVWNNEVTRDPTAVAEFILNELRLRPTLTLPSLPRWAPPSPASGRGVY
jgi:very-short-patch-repair endonuclease